MAASRKNLLFGRKLRIVTGLMHNPSCWYRLQAIDLSEHINNKVGE